MILRLIPAMLLGLGVSAVLFWLMHAMLQHHDVLAGHNPLTQVDFVRLKHEEPPPETITRELPPPVPDAVAPPPATSNSIAPASASQPSAPAFDAPKLDFSIGGGTIAAPVAGSAGVGLALPMPETSPGGPAAPDAFGGQLAAIVRIPPTYPMEARRKKIEGWARVEFTVLEDGSVGDIKVKSAQPAGVFDQAAADAIARWKFRPAVENGKPVRKRAAQTLKFELNK